MERGKKEERKKEHNLPPYQPPSIPPTPLLLSLAAYNVRTSLEKMKKKNKKKKKKGELPEPGCRARTRAGFLPAFSRLKDHVVHGKPAPSAFPSPPPKKETQQTVYIYHAAVRCACPCGKGPLEPDVKRCCMCVSYTMLFHINHGQLGFMFKSCSVFVEGPG